MFLIENTPINTFLNVFFVKKVKSNELIFNALNNLKNKYYYYCINNRTNI